MATPTKTKTFGGKRYTRVLGAYTDSRAAEARAQGLRDKGQAARVVPVDVGNRRYLAVYARKRK